MERYEHLQQLEEDLIDVMMVATRMTNTGPERYSLDDVLEHFGYTRDDLADMPE